MTEFDFVAEQANAWSEVVNLMLADPRNTALNGSVNGPGSSLEFTQSIREQLPDLLRKYGVSTLLDAPCGDLTWLRTVDLSGLYSYIGFDVEPRLIEGNKSYFRHVDSFTFVTTNLLTRKKFPKVDLILCRDFLAHLTNDYIISTLNKFKESGSRYLLASNYPGAKNGFIYNPHDFAWLGYIERPHDLSMSPFELTRIDGISENRAPSGVISREHELGLFDLQADAK